MNKSKKKKISVNLETVRQIVKQFLGYQSEKKETALTMASKKVRLQQWKNNFNKWQKNFKTFSIKLVHN